MAGYSYITTKSIFLLFNQVSRSQEDEHDEKAKKKNLIIYHLDFDRNNRNIIFPITVVVVVVLPVIII